MRENYYALMLAVMTGKTAERAMLEITGEAIRPPQKRDENAEKARALRAEGYKIQQIADTLGLSYGKTHRMLSHR